MDLVGLEEQSSIWGVSKEIQPESNMIQMIGANPGWQWCRLVGAVVAGDSNAESHTMNSS